MNDLPVRFLNPEFLVLLALVPLTWWLGKNSLAGLPKNRRRVALLLRIAIVMLMVLACARIQWHSVSERVGVYFLLDWSDSVPNTPPELRGKVMNYLKSASESPSRKPEDMVGVIYFGSDASCESPPAKGPVSLDRQAVVDTGGTDIAGALRLALSTFPQGTRRRIVVVSDGNQNLGDALSEAEAARAQGVRVDVYPITYRHDQEISVTKLILPESIQPGVPFKLTGMVSSTSDTLADVVVRRGGMPVKRMRVKLRKGRNVIPVGLNESDDGALAGVVDYRFDIEPVNPDDDRVDQNNSADAFTRVKGPPVILYVDGNIGYAENYHPLLHQALLKELRLLSTRAGADAKGDLRLHLRAIDDIPSEDSLAGYDCIILDNVPAEALGASRMERIRSLVNDQGVGLLMIGGDRSFGAGNYLNTPIEDALPVEMDLKHKKVYPNGALAIILHTCEFADGNTWAKKITKAAIDTLGAHDYVGVLLWDWSGNMSSGHRWLFTLQPAAARNRMKRLVDGANPGDMPDFDGSVKLAVTGLQGVNAAVKHIIVISDGDPTPPSPPVVNQIRNDKTMTLSAISIGSHSTPVVLRELAQLHGGGRFYDVKDARSLPRIFVKESMVVKRSLLWEKPFTPQFVAGTDPEFTQDLPGAVPQLHGYVASTAKTAADVVLVSQNENKDPILAHWRYGLGQTVAWTSDAKNRWGKDWLGWENYSRFWGGVVWRILREQPSNLRMSTEVEGDKGKIVVHAIADDGTPLSDLDLVAYITDPESKSLPRIRLRQTGVSTYEADFPAEKIGKYQVAVKKREGSSGPGAAAYGGASVPFSAEMEHLQEDEPFLNRLAEKGGGTYLDDGIRNQFDLFDRSQLSSAKDFQDLWKLLLAVAAILFPLDVFVRRVVIDYSEVFRKARQRYRASRGLPEKAEDEQMSRLKEAKRSAGKDRVTPDFISRQTEAGTAFELTREQQADLESQIVIQSDSQKEKPTTPPQPEESGSDNYTSRLLKAKKRARKDNK